MARQPKARESKSKARVDAFEELTVKARSGPKQDVSIDFRKISTGMARQGKKVMVMKVCILHLHCTRTLPDDFHPLQILNHYLFFTISQYISGPTLCCMKLVLLPKVAGWIPVWLPFLSPLL